ncbi:MAG: ATP-dependent DNA helicase RecG, partial [Flavobacteriales bacterium]|nr:ATP-dependent DNA helicase RecG [Flavobacteriales bacterium]
MSKLENDISFLKGVGPARADQFRMELGIRTWEDLLMHYPFRYVDKSQVQKVRDVKSDAVAVQLQGTIVRLTEVGEARAKRLVGIFQDETGTMELVWFKGARWLKSSLPLNKPCLVYGKPTEFKGKFNIAHPEVEEIESSRMAAGVGLKPVYSTTEKMSNRGLNSNVIGKLTLQLCEEVRHEIPEVLPQELIQQYKLISRAEALVQLHAPANAEKLEQARRRLKFEELFFLQLQVLQTKLAGTVEQRGVVFEKVGELFNSFYKKHLPFELTGAQKRVVKEIRTDVMKGFHMNRLVQGDVGSGKTIVALMAILLAIDNGYQSCLMAPTEILANQHYEGISQLLEPLGVRVELLTGSVKKKSRVSLMEDLKSGELKFIIGTHALIEPVVEFANLGLVVIDEQHRFGVAQRAALWKKAALPPHILVMTATPIPRTLAMTVYGDLDVSIIDELPPGRKPVNTQWHTDAYRLMLFEFIRQEIALGRQVYIVYPMIEESEKMDYKDLFDGYESMSRAFPSPKYFISIVHGRMKAEDRDFEMKQFIEKKTQIMVATTVIEVGVNVPNASVMVIESAERFGLSQLHQLRGRVGRGADQSYCVLMTGHKLSDDTKLRMETMVRTTDGFKIAEVDLRLRGPGDLAGTAQSGVLQLRIADMVKDQQMMAAARNIANEWLTEDPNLSSESSAPIREELL